MIWNLVPADKPFNSSKSDKLPSLDTYFDAFFKLQSEAIEIVQTKQPNNKYLEDYLTIFPDLSVFGYNEMETVKQKFKDQLQPLITIASNNGFEFLQ